MGGKRRESEMVQQRDRRLRYPMMLFHLSPTSSSLLPLFHPYTSICLQAGVRVMQAPDDQLVRVSCCMILLAFALTHSHTVPGARKALLLCLQTVCVST
jgi:hypothetical protein